MGHLPTWQQSLISAGAELGSQSKLSFLKENKEVGLFWSVAEVLLEAGRTGERTLFLSCCCTSLHGVLPTPVRNRIWSPDKVGGSDSSSASH